MKLISKRKDANNLVVTKSAYLPLWDVWVLYKWC